MPDEVFRKSYKIGETVPVINVFVGAAVDLFQEVGQSAPQGGPSLKAQLIAEAGPIKVPAVAIGPPLSNSTTETVKLSGVPVPIPLIRSIDIDLELSIVDYDWAPDAGSADNGVITFGVVVKLQFDVLGQHINIQLGPKIPVSITLVGTAREAAASALADAAEATPVVDSLNTLQRLAGFSGRPSPQHA